MAQFLALSSEASCAAQDIELELGLAEEGRNVFAFLHGPQHHHQYVRDGHGLVSTG